MANRKQKPLARRAGAYTRDHCLALIWGSDIFSAFSTTDHYPIREMKTAWPYLREKAFSILEERRAAGRTTRIMPWGWWEMEAPEKRNEDMSESGQLTALGIPFQQTNEG